MTSEHSYGFVPVYRGEAEDKFLLIRQTGDQWGFPKGHAEGKESPLETAEREMLEECGTAPLKVFEEYVFSGHYEFTRVELVKKTNTFFLCTLKDMNVRPQAGEIAECRFVTYDESLGMDLFEDTKRILAEARKLLPGIPRT